MSFCQIRFQAAYAALKAKRDQYFRFWNTAIISGQLDSTTLNKLGSEVDQLFTAWSELSRSACDLKLRAAA